MFTDLLHPSCRVARARLLHSRPSRRGRSTACIHSLILIRSGRVWQCSFGPRSRGRCHSRHRGPGARPYPATAFLADSVPISATCTAAMWCAGPSRELTLRGFASPSSPGQWATRPIVSRTACASASNATPRSLASPALVEPTTHKRGILFHGPPGPEACGQSSGHMPERTAPSSLANLAWSSLLRHAGTATIDGCSRRRPRPE